MVRRSLLGLLLSAAACAAQPAPPGDGPLTIDRVFASDEFRGDAGPPVQWLDGAAYTTLRPSKAAPGASDVVRVDAAGAEEVLVAAARLTPPGATTPLAVHGYALSKDLDVALVFTNSARVWRQNTRGDYWTFRRSTGTLARVAAGSPPATTMFAKLSPDGTRVGYVRGNDLYVEPAGGGPATRLTADGSAEVINGTFDWVYEEEFDCRDGWRWSPDGARVAYWRLDTAGVKTVTLTDSTGPGNYPALKTFAYPKAGERNSACRVGVVAAAGGPTTWLDVPGDTRTDFYLPRMEWAAGPRELAVLRLNRLQNTADVLIADADTGRVRTALTERDAAWLDVPEDAPAWAEGGRAFTWLSERDGWRHLYLARRDGGGVRQVTRGEFDVVCVLRLDERAGRVYFAASPKDATQLYLYSAPLGGDAAPTRLTPDGQPGWHDYRVAPDGSAAVHTHSAFGRPPRVELVSLPGHQVLRTLAANDRLRAAVEKLPRTPVEFVRVPVAAGVELDGWLMKPAGFDPAKKYPLLVHVYGEPASQSVTDRWGGSMYLWHLMLTQRGYAVACVDNRGTPCPRGRAWRKAAYRRVGTLASEDQAAAARELLKRPYLDPTRVGVWGWSGGGSMTLNLLFRSPELFRAGMAVAPVPDMRLYDTVYQERYMGLPAENAAAYTAGSPLTHAAGLRGRLLLVHGSGDDNCHYQGTERLADRLVALDKPFTLMTYPNRSHSVSEGANTTRHLYTLLTRYLAENLPAGPRP